MLALQNPVRTDLVRPIPWRAGTFFAAQGREARTSLLRKSRRSSSRAPRTITRQRPTPDVSCACTLRWGARSRTYFARTHTRTCRRRQRTTGRSTRLRNRSRRPTPPSRCRTCSRFTRIASTREAIALTSATAASTARSSGRATRGKAVAPAGHLRTTGLSWALCPAFAIRRTSSERSSSATLSLRFVCPVPAARRHSN